MTSKVALYQHLKEVFSLPNHFTNNLDSLWDILNEENEETSIVFLNVNFAREVLGNYAEKLIQLFIKLPEKNDCYRIYLFE